MKTLGQQLYECEMVVRGLPSHWDRLPEKGKDMWERVAHKFKDLISSHDK